MYLRVREHYRKGGRRLLGAKGQGSLLWDCVSYKWTESYIYDASTVWLPKQDLNNGNVNRHATFEGRNPSGFPDTPDKELQTVNHCWAWDPRDDLPNCYPIQKLSFLKSYSQEEL